MGNEQGKSIEQLRDKVHSGLELLSDQELALLFADTEQIAQDAPIPTQPTIEPSTAPAPAESAPPAEETVQGQANLVDLMPEKFRDKDEAASLQKMLKAMQEQESELTRKSQELSQLQNVVQELSRPREEYQPKQQVTSQPAGQPVKAAELEVEVDDLTFLDSPVANSKAIAEAAARKVVEEVSRRVSVEQIRDYDTFSLRRSTFEKFRSDHKDFDSIRAEFAEACRIHPEWDNDIQGLPKLYDFAKTLAKARGVTTDATPSTIPVPATPAVDMAALRAQIIAEVEASSYVKARQAITDEIVKRKAAAGIVATTPWQTPEQRVTLQARTTPLTPEEQAIKDMVDSGPAGLRALNPYDPSLSIQRASQ